MNESVPPARGALPCPAALLVPHARPMLWIEELTEWAEGEGRARGTIRPAHPLLERGRLHPFGLVELMAQAVAAHDGYGHLRSGRPPGPGFLGGVRDFHWSDVPFEGEGFEIACTRETSVEDFHVVRGTVLREGQACAEARLLLYVGALRGPPVPRARTAGLDPGSGTEPDNILEALDILLAGHGQPVSLPIGPGFPAFRGHFPGNPVLPAVALLVAGEKAAGLRREEGTRIGIRRAKFTGPVTPGDELELTWQGRGAPPARRCDVKFRTAGRIVARAVYEISGGETRGSECG